MKRGELEAALTRTNPWWRAGNSDWVADDRDLRDASDAPFRYEPGPLNELAEGGLYVLSGPRRVGKSVEMKRAIAALLGDGVEGRRVVHAACDGWGLSDFNTLVGVIDELAPPARGFRYLFLDEVTGAHRDWVARIKWLRDNTSLRDDCVVLTGSTAEQLIKARKLLAGRRGDEPENMRTLLPMGFRSFCRATGVVLPERLPHIRAGDMLRPDADDAIHELRVYGDVITTAWERYLLIGGYPSAVREWVRDREISTAFISDLWDVVHGDALATEDWTELQSRSLLERLAVNLGSPLAIERVAREAGSVHHDTIRRRLSRLGYTYATWTCHRGDGRSPQLNAQSKIYFVDPLVARLVNVRDESRAAPDFSQLTEQQIGMALMRQHDAEHPGRFAAHDAVMYQRTATGSEIDFVAQWMKRVPYESKYTEGAWRRESQTARTAYAGHAVLATRNVTEREGDARAVPAGILALLLDLTPDGAINSTRGS